MFWIESGSVVSMSCGGAATWQAPTRTRSVRLRPPSLGSSSPAAAHIELSFPPLVRSRRSPLTALAGPEGTVASALGRSPSQMTDGRICTLVFSAVVRSRNGRSWLTSPASATDASSEQLERFANSQAGSMIFPLDETKTKCAT